MRSMNSRQTGVSVIGVPIPDLRVYIVDDDGRAVPDGKPGEMYIAGGGVARGYLNRPELTAARFLEDGARGRLYRTGDLVRRAEDGELEYLGRIDHQVKVRGFRIELGEIEAALSAHPALRQAVVVAERDASDETQLWAYLVPGDDAPQVAQLRTYLLCLLPDYMVPSAFVFLDAIPTTSNGKVDRRALPRPHRKAAVKSATMEIKSR